MNFSIVLWGFIWAGMFSGIYNITASKMSSSFFGFFQGARALLPLVAAYLSLLWIMATRSRFPVLKTPLGLLFFYCLTGVVTSITISPEPLVSFYWAMAFLAPVLVLWIVADGSDGLGRLRRILTVNYGVIFLIALNLLPEALRIGTGRERLSAFYNLPFGLGQITRNGAARYALIVIIVILSRALSGTKRIRWAWLFLLPPFMYMLAHTQSRTGLLGLAVVVALIVFLRGLDLKLLTVGPAAAYIVWIAGYRWRAQGQLERLVFLTGREITWRKGIAQILQSPFLGWGFNADRILLESEHMHNSYLHALIQSGLIGGAFFVAAFVVIWYFVIKSGLIKRFRTLTGPDRPFLMESILILMFLTSRSFFESTGAFYGVDLLLLLPSIAYIYLWVRKERAGQ